MDRLIVVVLLAWYVALVLRGRHDHGCDCESFHVHVHGGDVRILSLLWLEVVLPRFFPFFHTRCSAIGRNASFFLKLPHTSYV